MVGGRDVDPAAFDLGSILGVCGLQFAGALENRRQDAGRDRWDVEHDEDRRRQVSG
jgi:hypothetical protein